MKEHLTEVVGTTAILGVVMPIFNEEQWLNTILTRVLVRPEVARVVAVDDGSTDGSWVTLEQWAARDARVMVLRHEHNRGKGAAIRTALARLDTPVILIQDSDLEYDPTDYPKLLEPIRQKRAEVVYGSRFSVQANGNPHWHTVGNRLLTWVGNQLTGLRLTDEATCYKLFKREVLQQIELIEDGFGFCPEVTAKVGRLVQHGVIQLVEVPIHYHGRTRAEGKKIRLWDGLSALGCLWKYSR